MYRTGRKNLAQSATTGQSLRSICSNKLDPIKETLKVHQNKKAKVDKLRGQYPELDMLIENEGWD